VPPPAEKGAQRSGPAVEEGALRPSRNQPRTLVLVRHGETDWNLTGRAQGHADVPLNATGHRQARAVARVMATFRPSRLWSSDLARAHQTAEAIAETTGLAVESDQRLREYDVGARSGLTLAELAESHPEEYAGWMAGRTNTVFVDEETTQQVRDRVAPALLECLERLEPGAVGVVVLHGACLKVGLMGILGWPWELARSIQGIENAAYCVLTEDLDRDLLRLTSYNEKAGSAPHGPDFVADAPVG
jgi:probable phosphoglycerate mutase